MWIAEMSIDSKEHPIQDTNLQYEMQLIPAWTSWCSSACPLPWIIYLLPIAQHFIASAYSFVPCTHSQKNSTDPQKNPSCQYSATRNSWFHCSSFEQHEKKGQFLGRCCSINIHFCAFCTHPAFSFPPSHLSQVTSDAPQSGRSSRCKGWTVC